MEWLDVAQGLCGALLGSGVGLLFYRQSRKKAQADADLRMAEANTKEWELEEKRIKELHEAVSIANATQNEHLKRISDLNHALDDKTDRIRSLTDRLYESEQEVNRLNGTVIALTRDGGRKDLLIEKYKLWHCRKAECAHRMPPNDKLRGKVFEEEL